MSEVEDMVVGGEGDVGSIGWCVGRVWVYEGSKEKVMLGEKFE